MEILANAGELFNGILCTCFIKIHEKDDKINKGAFLYQVEVFLSPKLDRKICVQGNFEPKIDLFYCQNWDHTVSFVMFQVISTHKIFQMDLVDGLVGVSNQSLGHCWQVGPGGSI